MRVILVNTRHYRGGGDSTYTFYLASLLRQHGHEVAFFAMRSERDLPDPNSDLFVSNIDFKEANRKKSLLTALDVLTRAVYSTEARAKFATLLDRFQPHVVHLQNIHAHITPSVILEANGRHLPIVWTLHDYKMVCPNSHFLHDTTGQICEACGRGHYYRAVVRRCKKGSLLASAMAALEAYVHALQKVRSRVDAFLAPSAFLRQKLIDRGFPSQAVHHLPLFLPDEVFQPAETGGGYLLFLGKLDPIKGVRPLLEACRMAPKVKLMLAGSMDESMSQELLGPLPANAQYVGMKYGQELRKLVRGALGVVLPSLCYENQPYSILEAFANAKPVIASALGGMLELVPHGERGLLVPAGDTSALADTMTWLVMHPEAAATMGHAAYAYARRVHGPDGHYRKLLAVYADVTNPRNHCTGPVSASQPS